MNSVPVLETLVRDTRYALRMLRKTPGFTAVALLTLALGIGANTAVFTVVNALLLQPLPYPRADRLGVLDFRAKTPRGENHDVGADAQMFFTARDNATTVDAALVGQTSGVNLIAGEQQVAYVQQQRVGAGYFHVLGIEPAIGREFTADEDRPGGPPVVILSYTLWTRVFGSDPSVVGKSILLRGESYTVIGVMPASFQVTQRHSFQGDSGVDLWTPLRPSTRGEGGGLNYGAVLRLRDGADWTQARNDLARLSAQAFSLWKLQPDVTVTLGATPMQEALAAGLKQPLLMLWGAVGVVLLIACVNLAGLLLARGSRRSKEIVTRLALGSGRAAVVRQLLVESAVLAVAGGVAGLFFGWASLQLLAQAGLDSFNFWQPIVLDWRVMAVTMGIALLTSVAFGLTPAVQASRLDVRAGLHESGTRSVAGTSSRWPRRVLVVVEVALAVVLLVGAGLLVRTFAYLVNQPPGFDTSNVITASISLQDARYRDPEKVNYLFEETLRKVRAVPNVQGAGVVLGLPYERLLNNGFSKAEDPPKETKITNSTYVTPGYFEAMRIPLVAGRAFTSLDAAESPKVAVINQSFARRHYKNENPLGRRLRTGDVEREIVGIVGDTQQGAAGWGNFGPISPLPCIYVPAAQTSSGFLTMVHTWFQPSWAIRVSGPIGTVLPEIERAIQSVDAQLPIAKVRTIAQVRNAKLSEQRFMMSLVTGLGAIALVLAAIGIHGLIASSVTERTRELGIRLALGSTGRQAIGTVVVPGVTLALAGVAIGSVAALPVTRLMRSFLWGVRDTDPVTFAAVVALLLAVACVASVIPALRILRLDPALTLRAE
jgi:predicted permease